MLGYLVCWTPYAVVAFWNSFFDPNALPVVLHCFPPLFAKASAALEPILFIVSNHRYKMALFELMMCGKDDIIADASRERERSKAQVSWPLMPGLFDTSVPRWGEEEGELGEAF